MANMEPSTSGVKPFVSTTTLVVNKPKKQLICEIPWYSWGQLQCCYGINSCRNHPSLPEEKPFSSSICHSVPRLKLPPFPNL